MREKQGAWILGLSIAVVVAISAVTLLSIRAVDEKMTSYCFDDLARTSQNLAAELCKSIESDRIILSSMAAIISSLDKQSDAQICAVMNSFTPKTSYISYVEFLFPGGRVLHQNGSSVTPGGGLDFDAEVMKGKYVSGKAQDFFNPENDVLRNAMPVVRRGQPAGVLYGVMPLADFGIFYKTDIYNGKAHVFLIDGSTGTLFPDSWHKTPTSLFDLNKRKAVQDFDFQTAISNIRHGRGGNFVHQSETLGRTVYVRYDPVRINNWSIAVAAAEETALSQGRSISWILYKMAAVNGIVLTLYMGCIIARILLSCRTVRRLSMEDRITGLQNRNAYDRFISAASARVFPSIACVYADVNGLHEINNERGHAAGDHMLRAAADAIKRVFPPQCVYRIGGDEFVALCEQLDAESCARSVDELKKLLEQQNYSISAGFACRQNELGADRVAREADENMLENKRAYYAAHDRRKNPPV